ncbi:MAG: hypothetical protein C0392_06315 [Syntrophus sp. (in: bacteria)]|nr:hypothetical protein [Syntrophus sp. (in: bacteria)]
MKSTRVLIVEDESIVAYNLEAILESFGYAVSGVVSSGKEVMAAVEETEPDVVLMDIVLQGDMDGIEAARAMQQRFDIPVVYMTGYADEETLERAKETAPFGYVVKPFGEREIHTAIQMAIYRHKTDEELRGYRDRLEDLVRNRTAELRGANERFGREILERREAEKTLVDSLEALKKVFDGTVNALAVTGELIGIYAAGHPGRVARLAAAIASEMAVPQEILEGIHVMGLLHDIGKMAVPLQILSKLTPLNSHEFDFIKTHPRAGYNIVRTIPFPWPVADAVLQHHERLNGTGYPRGLRADNILFEAKMLAIAEVVDVMANHQGYRVSLGIDRALDKIVQNKGTLFDSEGVDACVELFMKKGFSLS